MRNISKIVFILFVFLDFMFANTLIMGYRENERVPLIGKKGDDNGLYKEIYTKAAKKIGYELQIVRKPKKRILHELMLGKIDFYPGFTFTKERSNYTYYFENGLSFKNVGLSLNTLPLIKSIDELKGKKVLVSVGGPNEYYLSKRDDIILHKVNRLSIKKAISLLDIKRDDFYIYDKSSIEYYLKTNDINNMKLHPNCCGAEIPMYLGFSRFSNKYSEIENPNFNPNRDISIENFPTIVDKNSIAYKLYDALREMKESGEIDKLYNKYYR